MDKQWPATLGNATKVGACNLPGPTDINISLKMYIGLRVPHLVAFASEAGPH